MPTDYRDWPCDTDILRALKAARIKPRLTGDDLTERLAQIRNDVTGEVFRFTKRQFVPTRETRYFDGTGTAEVEVDEMVAFEQASVLGILAAPGYVMVNVALIEEQGKPKTRLMTARGSVPAWTTGGVIIPWPNIFPAGRRNIAVNGTWGFAETIPPDLWNAVLGEEAYLMGQEATFAGWGQLTRRQEGDTSYAAAPGGTEPIGWTSAFCRKLKLYKRPAGRQVRNLRPAMI